MPPTTSHCFKELSTTGAVGIVGPELGFHFGKGCIEVGSPDATLGEAFKLAKVAALKSAPQ